MYTIETVPALHARHDTRHTLRTRTVHNATVHRATRPKTALPLSNARGTQHTAYPSLFHTSVLYFFFFFPPFPPLPDLALSSARRWDLPRQIFCT